MLVIAVTLVSDHYGQFLKVSSEIRYGSDPIVDQGQRSDVHCPATPAPERWTSTDVIGDIGDPPDWRHQRAVPYCASGILVIDLIHDAIR
jgi:hypothetical protein